MIRDINLNEDESNEEKESNEDFNSVNTDNNELSDNNIKPGIEPASKRRKKNKRNKQYSNSNVITNDSDTVYENPSSKKETKEIKIYHKNVDWNYILTAYYDNPKKHDFSKYGYVVNIVKNSGETILQWNGKQIII